MTRETEALLHNPLFRGIDESELVPLLKCLQSQRRLYAKGERILQAGSAANRLGMVISGQVDTVYEDAIGGRSIINSFGPGQLFCDAFSCSSQQVLPVSIVADTDSDVALIGVDRILHACGDEGRRHQLLLMENLVHILADKYVASSRKMVHLSGRTTRRKLLSYLSEQLRLAGGNPFTIPFNRQELADYLFVDRTGLSAEWSKLKRQGLLSEKNGALRLNAPPCDGADCDKVEG
ncbi:MAG: Crp/Fnr family transcriptional regulator [Oscillospiraceae bacterium]|nr:Crp/Fnr family transcriptional regulator [Oscillospiraceae bacterium]